MKNDNIVRLIIVALAIILFVPFLGSVHLFDWDEINFAESAREMIVTGNYSIVQINYAPFWEKPPLFIWLQAFSMKLFGINEFAARFPNAIVGIVTLLFLFNIGTKYKNQKFGIFWVITYMGSLLPFLYFKSGIIDPWFNLFIFLGIYYAYKYLNFDIKKHLNITLSAIFIGLSILTKGPAGLVIFGLIGFIYLAINKFKFRIKILDIFIFLLALLLSGGSWFIVQILTGHLDVVIDFIVYQIRLFNTQDAGHGGFFGYHFIVMIFGVFPASVFAINQFKKEGQERDFKSFVTLMQITFGVVIILFTIVKTKIMHYSSMCYFPLTLLAANFLFKVSEKKLSIKNWQLITLLIIGIIYTLGVFAVSYIDTYKTWLISKNLVADPLAIESLNATGGWSKLEPLIATILLAGFIAALILKYKRPVTAILSTYTGTAVFTFFILMAVVPKIEKYSQGSLIEFYKSISQEDAYVTTVHHRSYAHYFYAEIKPTDDKKFQDKEWLLRGDIDKTVYIATKTKRKQEVIESYPELELLYDKNGFSFFKRTVKNDQ